MPDLSRLAAADPITICNNTTQVTMTGTSLDVNVTNSTGSLPVAEVAAANVGLSNIGQSAVNLQIVGSNPTRRGLLICNSSTNGALFIKYGATANTTTSYSVKILPGGYWEMPNPIYTGQVDGIWDAAGSGNALVTQLTS